ncbi:Putative LuxR-family transcriptional regulator [Thermogutta terrifontis]|uniref:LuxR-family transcriptional regulator n=1 Tax=Thermogutta terrifontis TaxID=1331910 RepID=A0A286RH78_9BACT|nr:hypothetical protein [Thermogutta terrifontis]ASV75325.1 Putative LuxR-family transcriptional regulator [Thermogutta terrifontis]
MSEGSVPNHSPGVRRTCQPEVREAVYRAVETFDAINRAIAKPLTIINETFSQLNLKYKEDLNRILEAHNQAYKQCEDEARKKIEDYKKQWQQIYGCPHPRTIEDWQQLAARAGINGETVYRGEWTLSEVAPIIEGYLLRLKDISAQLQLQNLALVESQRRLAGVGMAQPTETDALAKPPGKPEPDFCFHRDGDGWFIRAFGKEGHFKNRKGFIYLAVLIERAGKPVPMAELVGKAEGHSPDPKRTLLAESWQPVLDREAKKSLKDHLVKLTADIKQAEERGDVTLAEMLRKEFREVTNHLRVDTTPTGKSRQFARSVDKMRSQITNALSRAYQILHDGNMPELADHLKVCISCQGDAFIYLSSPPLPWFLG